MSDERRRIKEIVQREFHRTRHTLAYPVDAITDALLAAGYGDVAKARAETVEKCAMQAWPNKGCQKYESSIRKRVTAEIRALAQPKEPSEPHGVPLKDWMDGPG